MELITTKEYYERTWVKTFFLVLLLPIAALFGWEIFFAETALLSVISAVISIFFICVIINSFVHKIILGDDFIAEKTLLGTKKIFFKDITNIVIQYNFSDILADKVKIQIPKYVIENSKEIIGTVISKVKYNERVLYAGDPIEFQSYVTEFSISDKLVEYSEVIPAGFTFVEKVELIEKRWLYRVVNLTTSKGEFKISYFGKEMGYECVFVNDELVSKQDSLLWYIPKFSFNYQGINISVNVRIYPWLTIRKFWIEVDNRTVYSE